MPQWLKQKLHLPRKSKRIYLIDGINPLYLPLIMNHMLPVRFFQVLSEEAAILTMDGVGEWDTATVGVGERNRIQLLKSMHFPDSLGLLYSAFTYFCGFRVNSGEYKLMGLAPYGNPVFKDLILDTLIDLKEDGSFSLNLDYFNYCQGLTMTNDKFANLFGGPPRKSESVITDREINLASSIQAVTEKLSCEWLALREILVKKENLCISGGWP